MHANKHNEHNKHTQTHLHTYGQYTYTEHTHTQNTVSFPHIHNRKPDHGHTYPYQKQLASYTLTVENQDNNDLPYGQTLQLYHLSGGGGNHKTN